MTPLNLSEISVMTPPDGVTPNFVDPPSVAPATRIIIGVSMVVMYCFLALRIYTRLWVTHSFGVDDCLCLLAASTATAYCAVVLSVLGSLMGPHQWDVPLSRLDMHMVLLYTLVTTCLYGLTATFLKSALLALYLRIFRPARNARIIIWTSLIVINLFYVTTLVVLVSICGPSVESVSTPKTTSDSFDPDGSCSIPQRPLWISLGVFSVVTDFYLLAIPVGLILNVRLAPRRKFGVCCVFLTGLLVCAFSILSTVYRIQLLDSSDLTWLATLTYGYTAAEVNVGISCSCMPVVYVVFHNMTKATPWNSLVRLVHSRNRLPRDSSAPVIHIPEEQLPQMPMGTKMGVRSLVRNVHRSRSGLADDMLMYNELTAIDEGYHHAKRSVDRGSTGALFEPK
ncbi:hypothetical protein GGR54DRAFT_511638 [Hypoxylon sp. NC1633]|nr:hypothetical protein GGR54DRAFT_511638 [Hypoxylon sp. NC1633]